MHTSSSHYCQLSCNRWNTSTITYLQQVGLAEFGQHNSTRPRPIDTVVYPRYHLHTHTHTHTQVRNNSNKWSTNFDKRPHRMLWCYWGWNDPFCCMPLLTTEWSLLLPIPYWSLSTDGNISPQTRKKDRQKRRKKERKMLLETKRKRSCHIEFLPQYYDEELLSGSRGYLVRFYFVKLSTKPACQLNQRQPWYSDRSPLSDWSHRQTLQRLFRSHRQDAEQCPGQILCGFLKVDAELEWRQL